MRFSREPVAWVGAILAILTLVHNFMLGQPITSAMLEPVMIAIGTLIARSKVTPVAKTEDE